MDSKSLVNPTDVAVVGLSGRFPGCTDIETFWSNLMNGVEMIRHFKPEELEYAQSIRDPENAASYVRSRSVLEGVDQFDSSFFGIYPKEADAMDPQHRLFLECTWEAIESAGYNPLEFPGTIGLYAGLGINSYLLFNHSSHPGFAEQFAASYPVGSHETLFGNDKDFLTTRIAYKLNLRGPCVTVQTACSTSLVAIVQAYYSLLTNQCDMALAGGVSITFPQKRDYLYRTDGMVSKDGTCRSFDADASGTVFGSGLGVVVLKRLADAIADGDQIRAVIKGGAVNNDGAGRIGYAAPGVDGQAEVISMAHASAGVTADTISYVEAHGTGTPLGDPIEVAALTRAFHCSTRKEGYCALGTAKTHVGHLEMAAGVTGFIKTVLQLEREKIPPLLHFARPNPKIDFANSPFYPAAKMIEWKRGEIPRRAGVSAFGVGGTNSHVVLEEAPQLEPGSESRAAQLVVLSARTSSALEIAAGNLATQLERSPDLSLADVAFTLHKGRRAFAHRRALVCRDAAEAVKLLRTRESKRVFSRDSGERKTEVAFLFPGQGAQYSNMGRGLYQSEPVYRDAVDRCAVILQGHLGLDIRSALYPKSDEKQKADGSIVETRLAQPCIFTVEYALSELWASWGVKPSALLGHSIGEYVAAVLAGTLTLEDALGLIAARGRLMQQLPGGSMLAVRLTASQVQEFLSEQIALAAENSPTLTVLSGPTQELEELARRLHDRNVISRFLDTSHAFHSSMMEPIVKPFTEVAAKVPHHPPLIPWVSTYTGAEITAGDFPGAEYWGRQLRQHVRFTDALQWLLQDPARVLLEVGPGQTLSSLARKHPKFNSQQIVLSSLQSSADEEIDGESMLNALGRLWISGVAVNWEGFHAHEKRRRVLLPTYPFERKSHWVTPVHASPAIAPPPDVSLDQHQPLIENAEAVSERLEFPTREITEHIVKNRTENHQNGASGKDRAAIELAELFASLSGMDNADISTKSTFMELGFDSLFLTQASQSLQKKFGLKVSFRQMLNDLSSIDILACHLAEKQPERFAAEMPPARPLSPPTMASSSPAPDGLVAAVTSGPCAPAEGSLIDRILTQQSAVLHQQAQQLTIIQQQLELLRGGSLNGSPSASASTSTAPTSPASPTPAPASKPAANVTNHAGTENLGRFGPFKGIEIGPKGGLSPKQEKALAELIARYNRRTAGSKAYAQQHRFHFCDPRAAGNFRQQWKEMVYPIVCARSHGAKIWDIDGNEYLDVTLGFGANYFGHSPEFVVKAVDEQLHKGFEIGPQNPLAGEVAQMLCELTGMERATFCNTGSEAVMAALRIARTVTAKDKIVYFNGDYHGIFDEVLARAGKVNGKIGALPAAPGIPPLPNMIVLEYGSPASLDIIQERADEIAAVIVEPVQSRHPDLQPKEFLHALRKLTTEKEIALIFDEVVTGFRAALGGAQEYFGVRADLGIYGKVLGGGMPIGVLAGSRRFMDALDGGNWSYGDDSYPEVGVTFFAGTFVRHPLAMAAAHATLKHLREAGPDLQRQTTGKTARMVRTLNDYFVANEVPIRLQTFSSVFFYDFHPDLIYGNLLFYYLRDRGVHIWEGRVGQICTAHSEEDINYLIEAFKVSVEEMQASGFLPGRNSSGCGPANAQATADKPVVRRAPLTEAQREIWIATQMGEDANCAYNESCSLHFKGRLDVAKLQNALEQVINRHDALRIRFDAMGEYQEFAATVRLDIPLSDLTGHSDLEQADEIASIIKADMATPFDLVNGPVFRAQLLKRSDDQHQFIFTTHHAVCDGWSFAVIFHELAQFYSALVESKPCDVVPAMQFQEFAEWSRERQKSPEFKQAEQYWIQKFQGAAVPVLDLPCDRPRPALKTYHGSLAVRKCDPQVFQSLKKASGAMGHTVFGVLFSAFYTLLHRLTGQEDIVVGIPAAGQSRVGSDDLVGHCLNFLPTRNRLNGSMPFAEFAANIKKDVFDVYDYQDYTYGTLISKLQLPRNASHLPLLSVMFNIDKRGMDKLKFSGVKAQVTTNAKQYVNFDLFLNLVQGDNELDLECEFNTDLFDRETVMRRLGHFESLMRAIAADVRIPLGEMALLTNAERRELIVEWNRTAVEYRKDILLHELIQEQARSTPDAVAVIFENQRMTYGELDQRTNQLARYLKKLGIGPNTMVGICLERSPEMMIGLLGILKAGGAYVPMDPEYPRERLEFMLADSNVSVLLTQARIEASLPAHGARLLRLDADWKIIAAEDAAPLAPNGTTQDMAYMIYTSGSSGRPKGAMNTHAGIVNRLLWMQDAYHLTSDDRVMQKTPFSFDVSVWEFFWPLMTGAGLVVASPGMHKDGAYLATLIAREKITTMHFVPSMLGPFLEINGLNVSCASLRRVICSGEALSYELQQRFFSILPAELHNLYGPTEAAVDVTYWACERNSADHAVPIGRPIANTQIYVLDRNLQPMPIGVPGELHIGGVGLARGYHNRPDLTREKFIPNPFGLKPAERLYKTGDLARFRRDGAVEYLGRLDNQVKLRGFRIELGEIENVLNEHPAVRESVVVVKEDKRGQRSLAGYFTRKAAANGSSAAHDWSVLPKVVMEFIRPKLPDYMIPPVLVVLNDLPLTPNGKVDRNALAALAVDGAVERSEFLAPRNNNEKALAEIWKEILGLEKVGVLDNFFELGGDSLLSFRVANRANQAGIHLTPRLILEHKNIASLVRVVETGKTGMSSKTPAITRAPREAHRRKLPAIEWE